jgi:hypothetical protein
MANFADPFQANPSDKDAFLGAIGAWSIKEIFLAPVDSHMASYRRIGCDVISSCPRSAVFVAERCRLDEKGTN